MDNRRLLSRKALVAALAAASLMVVTAPGVADVQVAHGYGMGSGMMGGYEPGAGTGPGMAQGSGSISELLNNVLDFFDELRAMGRANQEELPVRK